MFRLIKDYGHERVVFGWDPSSNLRCIIAVHSTTLGPAAGGCRFWSYESDEDALRDALRLSRAMTYKYAAAGVNLGGGKAVLIGDPSISGNEREALFRSLGRLIDSLGGTYYTGQDVGTTLKDMEFIYSETPYVITLPEYMGGSGFISSATAWGVFLGLKVCVELTFGTKDIKGLRIAVQGVGSVGSSLVEFAVREGALVTVADINQDRVNEIASRFPVTVVGVDEIFNVDCDVFSPCALGGILNPRNIERLKCRVVAGAANNQLASEEECGKLLAERNILYAPDFIINAGGAIYDSDRLFSGRFNKERATKKVEEIPETLKAVFRMARQHNMLPQEAAYKYAEDRLKKIHNLRTFGRQVKR